MSVETLLLLVLIVLLLGAIPSWPYNRSWGYGPLGILTVVVVIFVVWALAEHRPLFGTHRDVGADIHDTVKDAGHEMKKMGRDAADSVRDAVN